MNNVVSNFDFSEGLASWNPNSCHAYVVCDGSGYINGIRPNSGSAYAIVTQRTQNWQGLEQDITDKIVPDTKYIVSAYVTVCGEVHEPVIVSATLKLENYDDSTNFLCVGRYDISHLFRLIFFTFTMVVIVLCTNYMHNSSHCTLYSRESVGQIKLIKLCL
jgi:Carbohydrate binding domain